MAEIYETENITVSQWEETRDIKSRHTYDPCSLYAETFWLPILGPSSILFLRFISRQFNGMKYEEELTFELKEIARCIGLSEKTTQNSPMLRTLSRCIDFGMAQQIGPGKIKVRKKLPLLSVRHQNHLPISLQKSHREFEATLVLDTKSENHIVQRARQLALSLVNLGEEPDICEQHLLRWGFHPSLTHESVSWAQKQTGRNKQVSPNLQHLVQSGKVVNIN